MYKTKKVKTKIYIKKKKLMININITFLNILAKPKAFDDLSLPSRKRFLKSRNVC